MVESRCGIYCSKCPYREKVGCKGCLNIPKPFWGNCALKSCCEGRKLEHCGLCADFPCATLNQFAYDKEQGDNGRRIEHCKEWAAAK